MAAILVIEESITVGNPSVVEGGAPEGPFAAVFEDDGTTGYFYGLDFRNEEEPIVDARHIYDVEQVRDRDLPSVVRIAWSADSQKTVLVINDVPHAIIDFSARRSYCRSGFPPPTGDWSDDISWQDSATELFADTEDT